MSIISYKPEALRNATKAHAVKELSTIAPRAPKGVKASSAKTQGMLFSVALVALAAFSIALVIFQ